ncbi:3',5'-cyclic adenosine monophosphate phosphodiesterase CpdA [Ureibacillus acetophenoni]
MKIVVFGDLHYPTIKETYAEMKHEREIFFKEFLNQVFKVEADLYVSLGDLTNYGLQDELEEIYRIINEHNKPFVHVIGNHDSYALSKVEMLEITKQERYRAIHNDQLSLVFLDTAKEQDYKSWGGTVDDKQLEWLKDQIEVASTSNMIVFAHHPIYNTTMNSEKENLSVDPEIPLKEVLNKKSGVNIYMNGHNHFNSIVQDENWTYIQVAAVMDEIGARIIEVTDEEMKVSELNFTTEELRATADHVGETIDHFRLAPQQLADESQRNITIERNPKVVAK